MSIAAMRVPTVFTAVDRFSSVVNTMTRNAGKMNSAMQGASMRTSKVLSTAGTSMLSAGVGIASGIGLVVNEAGKFEKAMANVSTTIDSTPESMRQMSEAVLSMAKRTPVPISELTAALYDVVSAGIDAKDSMFVLEQSSKLGIAGLGTAKEGVDIITSSLNSFNLKASESANVANMVFKAVKYGKTTVSELAESFGSSSALVKNANVSLAEYLATTATLTTTGMTASRAQTQVSSAVSALIKPSGTMSKVFKKLGVKDVPAWIKSNGSLVKSLQIVRDEGEKMGLLTSKSFGRKEGFSAMLSLLGPLAEKYKLVMGDIVSGTDSMTEAVAKQQKTFSAQFQLMKNKVSTLAISVGNQLLPAINELASSLGNTVEMVSRFAENNKWLASAIFSAAMMLLKFGLIAKIASFTFGLLSKAIGFCTAIVEAYTFVSSMAALANVSFATALGGVAVALWTAYWPILAVAAVLGVLIYAFSDTAESTEDMVDRQISALNKSNNAMTNSTNVVASEMKKQQELMKKNHPFVVSPNKPLTDAQKKFQKIQEQEKIAKQLAYNDSLRHKDFNTRQEAGRQLSLLDKFPQDFEKNELAKVKGASGLREKGMSFNEIAEIYPQINTAAERKQQLEIIIKDASGTLVEAKMDGKTYGPGMPVYTKSTTGQR